MTTTTKTDSRHEPDPAWTYERECAYLRGLLFNEVSQGEFEGWTEADPRNHDLMCLRLVHRGSGWLMEAFAPYAQVRFFTRTPASLPACVTRLAGMSRKRPLRGAQRALLEKFAGLFRRPTSA